MQQTRAQRQALLRSIEAERQSRVLAYVLADGALIADDVVVHLYDKLVALGPCPRIDFLLASRGGFTEVTWKIISLLREFTPHLGVIIPYRAHSGATLIALAADEIVMGPMSELSPTDAARSHFLLPTGPDGRPANVSVEDLRRCIEFIRREGGERADFVTALFNYIHPLAIGALEQAHALTEHIARKALATHWDPAERAADIERVVTTLNGRLHSHTYPISRVEAREDLGLPVVDAPPRLWAAIWELYSLYNEMLTAVRPARSPEQRKRYACVIETAERSTALYRLVRQADGAEQVMEVGWETLAPQATQGGTVEQPRHSR